MEKEMEKKNWPLEGYQALSIESPQGVGTSWQPRALPARCPSLSTYSPSAKRRVPALHAAPGQGGKGQSWTGRPSRPQRAGSP